MTSFDAAISARAARAAEADFIIEQADDAIRRRQLGTIRFASARKALLWYFEQSTLRNQPKSPGLDCDHDYQSVKASVPCKAGRLQDPDEAFVVLASIHGLFERWAKGLLRKSAKPPGIPYVWKALAVALVLRDGKTQSAAASIVRDHLREAGVPAEKWEGLDQCRISRWIGDCEDSIAGPLIEAGIIV